jgi:HEAT repeat protein
MDVAERELLQSSAGTGQYLLVNLSVALEGVKDPKAIPALSRLLNSRYTQTRRSAAYAIRQTGSNDSIKPLTQALYDSDRDVRYQAVMGLTEITKQYSWGPSIDRYHADEQRYLEYWRKWAKER